MSQNDATPGWIHKWRALRIACGALLLAGCTPHYFVVEYQVVHADSHSDARPPEPAAAAISTGDGDQAIGAPASFQTVLFVQECPAAADACALLRATVIAQARSLGIPIVATRNEGQPASRLLVLDQVTLGGPAADLYSVESVRYLLQTSPTIQRPLSLRRKAGRVDARCRVELFNYLDATEEILTVLKVKAHLVDAATEQTMWQHDGVYGDEELIQGNPRFFYRAGDYFSLFGTLRAWATSRPHNTICQDHRVQYPLLGPGKTFGTPRRRDVLLFARSVQHKGVDVEVIYRKAADDLLKALVSPRSTLE